MIKILIVDDDPLYRVLVTHLLSEHYEVVHAEDGQEGLSVCESARPDVVVTDLMMPHMDGMELLSVLQMRYPEIPVIMMTAEGTETTATEAMQRGAASYVPKPQVPERLKETVDQIVDLARADRDYARLTQRIRYCRYIYQLESDFTLIAPLVEFVQQVAIVQGICSQGSRHRIGVALEEALLNAMYHGNLQLPAAWHQELRSLLRDGKPLPMVEERCRDPLYADRRVLVDVTANEQEIRLVIQDQGQGFCHQRLRRDQRSPEVSSEHRGILLIESIMDDVSFNDVGNQITMVKTRPTA